MEFKIIVDSPIQESCLLSILLFTDSHPEIKKCLGNDVYWKSLNERSGNKWIIYSVKPKQGTYVFSGGSSQGYMGMLTQIWNEPEDNKQLIKALGIKSTEELPIMLFFKLNKDNNIENDVFYLKIEGRYDNEINKYLENIINKVLKAIEKDCDVFKNVKSTIIKEKTFTKLKNWIDFYSYIKDLIPGI